MNKLFLKKYISDELNIKLIGNNLFDPIQCSPNYGPLGQPNML